MADTSQNVAFVRTEQLPQMAPPASEVVTELSMD